MSPKHLDPKDVKVFLATWGYSGFSKVAPAAVASFTALLGVVLLRESWFLRDGFPLTVGVVAAVGFAVAGPVETIFGVKDDSRIVIDDVLGLLLSIYGFQQGRVDVLLGLWLLFRVIDNSKVFPLALIERRLKGGTAIMLDDVVAGLYVNIAARLAAALLSR
ncbi:MAG: phosphatidylglycerophosphatase A [Elusimicrobia bacterium]|nr:phosphatidylglycerophosphatase A [Elusimicrobiota bacterium]